MDKPVLYDYLMKNIDIRYSKKMFDATTIEGENTLSIMGFKLSKDVRVTKKLVGDELKNSTLLPLDVAYQYAKEKGVVPNKLSFYHTRENRVYLNIDHYCYVNKVSLQTIIMHILKVGGTYNSLVNSLIRNIIHNDYSIINSISLQEQNINVLRFLSSIGTLTRDKLEHNESRKFATLETLIFLKLRFNMDYTSRMLKTRSYVYIDTINHLSDLFKHDFSQPKYHKEGKEKFLDMIQYFLQASVDVSELSLDVRGIKQSSVNKGISKQSVRDKGLKRVESKNNNNSIVLFSKYTFNNEEDYLKSIGLSKEVYTDIKKINRIEGVDIKFMEILYSLFNRIDM